MFIEMNIILDLLKSGWAGFIRNLLDSRYRSNKRLIVQRPKFFRFDNFPQTKIYIGI